MNDLYFGFDTSNYTTSFAVCSSDGVITKLVKIPLGVPSGERGLRQSDAVFKHTVNLRSVADEISSYLSEDGGRIRAVGCSVRPRDVEGSYMPCFLVGSTLAHNLGAVLGVPVFEFSHQAGHIAAALYGSGATHLYGREFIAFHVSGGTTEVLHVDSSSSGQMKIEKIGGTKDLNAGQIIDRCGVMMGLPFPSGKEMEQLASEYVGRVPKYKVKCDGLDFNLSGLENKAAKLFSETRDARLCSSFVLNAVSDLMSDLTSSIEDRFPGLPIIYSGGVMSCGIISSRLSEKGYFAKPEFSSDNAAGTAYLAMLASKSKQSEV